MTVERSSAGSAAGGTLMDMNSCVAAGPSQQSQLRSGFFFLFQHRFGVPCRSSPIEVLNCNSRNEYNARSTNPVLNWIYQYQLASKFEAKYVHTVQYSIINDNKRMWWSLRSNYKHLIHTYTVHTYTLDRQWTPRELDSQGDSI